MLVKLASPKPQGEAVTGITESIILNQPLTRSTMGITVTVPKTRTVGGIDLNPTGGQCPII